MRTWGARLGLGYGGLDLVPGRSTTVWAIAGSAYESLHYGRDSKGILESPDSDEAERASYGDWNTEWALGIEQGLVPGEGRKDSLKAFLYYQGRCDERYRDSSIDQYLFESSRRDRGGGIAEAGSATASSAACGSIR